MRIMIVSGYGYWGDFDPSDLFVRSNKDIQIGGGETAMLSIARALADRRHEVMLFYDTKRSASFFGIDFLPTKYFMDMSTHMDHDVLISWDAPSAFRFNTLSKAKVMAFQLNDPAIGVYDWTIDLYMHPSEWHALRTKEACPEVCTDKQRIYTTNGVDYSRYLPVEPVKKEKRVIYSSSPDRGLHHLLRIWPEVSSRVPEATLHVFYDANRWLANDLVLKDKGVTTITSERAEILRQQFKNLPKSVVLHGGVNQFVLADEQMRSWVMAYPCDPVRPTEGFSMSILEGISSGCHVVTTDADALKELWATAPNVTCLPLPMQDDVWANTIVEKLRSPAAQPYHSPRYTWSTIAGVWEREIYSCLSQTPTCKR